VNLTYNPIGCIYHQSRRNRSLGEPVITCRFWQKVKQTRNPQFEAILNSVQAAYDMWVVLVHLEPH